MLVGWVEKNLSKKVLVSPAWKYTRGLVAIEKHKRVARVCQFSPATWMAGRSRSHQLLISLLLSSSVRTTPFHISSSLQKLTPSTANSLLFSRLYSMSKRKDGDDDGSSAPAAKKRATKKQSADGNSSSVAAVVLPCVPDGFQPQRARVLTTNHDIPSGGECVVYWMSRDQRVEDNHAMLYARGCAAAHNVPLKVCFNLVPTFLEATLRQYDLPIYLSTFLSTHICDLPNHLSIYLPLVST